MLHFGHRNVPLSLRSCCSLSILNARLVPLRWWFERLHCLCEVLLCGAALGQGCVHCSRATLIFVGQGFPVSASELAQGLVVGSA